MKKTAAKVCFAGSFFLNGLPTATPLKEIPQAVFDGTDVKYLQKRPIFWAL